MAGHTLISGTPGLPRPKRSHLHSQSKAVARASPGGAKDISRLLIPGLPSGQKRQSFTRTTFAGGEPGDRMKIASKIIFGTPFAAFLLPVLISAVATGTSFHQQSPAASADGALLYQQKCAACHDNAQDRIPPLFLIRRRSAEDVIRTLTTGSMKQQAAGLSADEIRSLAIHPTGKKPGAVVAPNLEANRCDGAARPINLNAPQWNGWGRDLDNSRYQPKPGIKAEDVSRLKVKWAWAHPGPMATGSTCRFPLLKRPQGATLSMNSANSEAASSRFTPTLEKSSGRLSYFKMSRSRSRRIPQGRRCMVLPGLQSGLPRLLT